MCRDHQWSGLGFCQVRHRSRIAPSQTGIERTRALVARDNREPRSSMARVRGSRPRPCEGASLRHRFRAPTCQRRAAPPRHPSRPRIRPSLRRPPRPTCHRSAFARAYTNCSSFRYGRAPPARAPGDRPAIRHAKSGRLCRRPAKWPGGECMVASMPLRVRPWTSPDHTWIFRRVASVRPRSPAALPGPVCPRWLPRPRRRGYRLFLA